MKELITIKNKNGNNLVSSRELYLFLEVKRDYTTWIKGRIEKYNFEENVDYTIVSSLHQNGGKGGRPQDDYIIKLDMAKELSMIENNLKGREARKYFIDCEKKLKENIKIDSYMISDPIERAKAWIKEEEERKELALKNKNLTTEIIHKEDVIVGLVKDITLAEKRQRITQIIRFNSIEYKNRYSLLYSEFEKKYHIDLSRRLESEEYKKIKPKIKNKMDLIDRGLNMIPELYELTCILFETDYQEILKKFEQGEL